MIMNKYSIVSKNVSKVFSKKNSNTLALNDFSISIPKGTIYGLLGPNGAGKSTFINILSGIVFKSTGKVFIEDIDQDADPKFTRKKIGVVPQELNIDPFFTPLELLELQAGLYGIPKKQRKTEEILEKLSLTEQKNAYARTLSGGMRRRLLIAKALVHDPEIIVLDEPTAGVDVDLRKTLWEYVKELKEKGKTICLTTHYLEEAEKLCDYITIINKGKKIVEDKKTNLLNLFNIKKVTFDLLENKNNISKIFNKFKHEINEKKLSIEYNKTKINLSSIIKILNDNDILYSEISTYDEDLESVFLKLIK
tara:strand:- start:7526 stop:8449 length:924 start_codon:yes stop_codon:yes gene_type:complete